MKKTGLLLAVALMLLIVLPACGSNGSSGSTESGQSGNGGDSAKDVTLTLWSFNNPDDPASPLGQLFGHISEEYQKAFPDRHVTIKHEYVPFEDYIGVKMRTAFASGTAPDLFLSCPSCMVEPAQSGNMVDFNQYLTDEQKSDFFENSSSAFTMDGKMYAIPFSQAFELLWYDKDVFKEKGLQPPTNWDELVKTGTELTSPDRYGLANYTIPDAHLPMPNSPFVWSNGTDYISKDGKKAMIADPKTIESLTYMRNLMTKKIQSPKTSRPANDTGIIADGETAMQINGSWAIGELTKNYPDRNLGFVPVPAPAGGTPVLTMGGWGMAANAKGKHVKEAVDFAKWFAIENNENALNLAYLDGSLPVRKSLTETDEYKSKFKGELWDDVLPLVKYTRSEPRGIPEAIKVVIDLIDEVINSDSRSIEDIAKDYNAKLQKIIDDHPDAKVLF